MFFSKKKNKVESDFDLDDGLDFDDFDFPDPDVKDDRKPVVKVADGIVTGAVEKVKDTAFLKQTLKDSLPDSYGESMDTADQVKESIKDLYDESAKEIKPAIKEGKRLIGKLVPKESKLVPKAVYEAIDRWKEEDAAEKRGGVLSKEAQQEAMLSSQLSDIFKVQTEMAVAKEAKEEGHERLQEGIALTRHNELSDYARMTATSVDKLQKYEESITLGYQKKSLELQFRQLFMLQDTLQFSKEDSAKRDNILTAISKNTTLPEAVKIKNTEVLGLTAKNKFSETMYRSLFGGRENVVENILTNVKKRVLEQVRGAVGMFSMTSDAAGQMAEMRESMNLDGYTEGGKMAGGAAVGKIGQKIGGSIRDFLEEGKLGTIGQKIVEGGKKAQYFNENIAQQVNTFRTKDHDDGTFLGAIKTFFQDFIPNMRPDLGVDVSSSKNITAQQVYTRRTEKSITEIIPGYLSRILREVQVLRTGNEKIELTQYDLDKNKFTSKSKLDAKLLPKTISQSSANWTNRSLESLMKQIDPSGKALSDEAKLALKKKLLTSSSLNQEGNEDYLASDRRYQGMAPKLKSEILPLMQKFFADMDQDKRNEFTSNYNSLAGTVASPQYAIQEEINLGNITQLRKLGLVKKDSDQIDMDKVFDYILATKEPRKAATATPAKAMRYANADGALTDREAFVGPRQPKPTMVQRAKTAAQQLKQRLADQLAPESMEQTGQALRQKSQQFINTAKDQVDNPTSASNTFIEKTQQKFESLKQRGSRARLKAIARAKNAKKKASELLDTDNKGQSFTDQFKNSTSPLSSFFRGLTTAPTSEEQEEEEQIADSKETITAKQSTSALPTTLPFANQAVLDQTKKPKNKSKAKAQAKAARKTKNKQAVAAPTLTPIAAAIDELKQTSSSIPTTTLAGKEQDQPTQEKPSTPLNKAKKGVLGILGDIRALVSNPKKLAQQVTDKASSLVERVNEATGGSNSTSQENVPEDEPLSLKDTPAQVIKKLGKKARDGAKQLKGSPQLEKITAAVTDKAKAAASAISVATGGEEGDLSSNQPVSIKDSPAQLLKKMGKKGRVGLQKLKASKAVTAVTDKAKTVLDKLDVAAGGGGDDANESDTILSPEDTAAQILSKINKKAQTRLQRILKKPKVSEIKDKAAALTERLQQTAKTASERSAKQNVNAVLEQVNTIVDDIKSGKTKDVALDKAKKVKDELIKPNIEKILGRLKVPDGVMTDVRVSGEEMPRLTALKLQEGHYFDVTSNRVITKYSDITGPVIDVTNNDSVVIEAKDIPNLTRIDPKTNTPVKLDVTNFRIPDPKELLNRGIQKGVGKITEMVFSGKGLPMDVFIEGQGEPILLGIGMLRGEYFDKETSKPIRHETEINGAVVNAEGTELISVQQIPLLRVWVRENKKFEKIKYVGNILAKIAKGLWHYQTKIAPKWAMFNLRMLKKAAVATGKFLIGDWKDGVKDVYVKGEQTPRLYAARIKAGDYMDFNTGDIINHQEEIKGAVVDRTGEIVIPEGDLDRLQVYDSVLKIFNPFRLAAKALRLLKRAAVATVKGTAKAAWWAMKKGAQITGKALGALGSAGARLFQKAQDVFVRGETKERLVGITMKEGGYFSKKTGKPIYIPDDIDGPVVDKDGETVLTEDHIKMGLTDRAGKPFKSKALQVVMGALGYLNKKLSLRVKLNTTKGGLVSQKLMKDPAVSAGDKTVSLLTDIKSSIDRFFQPKKSILGDTDGDGDRDNSSEDKRKKREEDKKNKKDDFIGPIKPTENKDKKPGWLGMLLPAIGGLIAKISGLTSVFGILKTVLQLIPGVGAVGKAIGAVAGSKAGQAVIGAAGKGIVAAGKGALGLAVRALPALGALATGAAGATGIGGTVAAVGGGLMAFLSSPVVLGVAATAAIGYGGYKLYNYLKNDLSLMEKLRYVQYGFPKSDLQHASKILELEKYLKGFIKESDQGLAINEANMDVNNLMAPWGLDSANEDHMTSFFRWYQERFKPVYLTHLTAIKAATQKTDLSVVEKLKGAALKQYLDSAKFSDGPYHVTSLPFAKPDFKATTSTDVRAVVDELVASLAKDTKKGVTAAELKAPASTTAPAAQKSDTALKSLTPLAASKPNESLPTGQTVVTSLVNSAMTATDSRANAVDAIRFKAYGLTELDTNKVAALKMLEREVVKQVTYDSKSTASWKGNPIALLENMAGSFGIGELYSKESNDWALWFTERFLVVYMAYLSAMRAYTGKVDVSPRADMLTSEQQLQLAKLIIGLKGIWGVKASAWPNYAVSANSDVTKENLNLLDDVAKTTKLQEDKKTSNNTDSTKLKAAPELPKEALKPPVPNKTLTQLESPDAEVRVNASTMGGGTSDAGLSSATSIAIAGGELVDGRNAQAHLSFGKDVNLSRMNPTLLKQFYGMAEEYGKLTGKKVSINDAFRSYEEQVAMKQKYGPRAAAPGNSLHEFGLAMDINAATLNEMDKMGLMRKYGFTRPVGGEPWHMEPAGIQSDISGYKRNTNDASHAIAAGIGRGGGGLGTVANAPLYARNSKLAMKLLEAPAGKPIDNKPADDAVMTAQEPPAQKSTVASMVSNVSNWFGSSDKPAALASAGAGAAALTMDAETKPAPSIFQRVKNAFGFSSNSNVNTSQNNLPADPSVKVPDAKGSGFGAVKDTIAAAAKMVGIDPSIMFKTAAVESGFNPSAKAGTSSASGLFQFTKGTWEEMVTKYGAKYGYTPGNVSPFDPKASAIMGAHYIKDSMAALGKRIGRAVGATETYMAHFLGPAGAGKFLTTMDKNPQAPAAQVMPEAAASNKAIFYDNGRPRTMMEVYSVLDKKVATQARAHGVPASATDTTTKPVGATPAASVPYNSPHIPGLAGTNKTPNISPVSFNTTAAASASPVAAAITNQNNSPLTDAYGFKPMQNAVSLAPQGQGSQMGKELFATTENLMGQSVEIQKKMLEVMSNIFGVMSSNKPAALGEMPQVNKPKDTTTQRYSENYTVPKAPVSMARSRLST